MGVVSGVAEVVLGLGLSSVVEALSAASSMWT